jgi:surface protein
MKSIKQHIYEALKINSKSKVVKNDYKYFPKTKNELIENIREHFKNNIYDLNDIDTSEIVNMSNLFDKFSYSQKDLDLTNYFEKINISKWNVSNVKEMFNLFRATNFNGDISGWDVSKVTNMRCMFGFSKFNGDISQWDVSNVEDMDFMFKNSEFNQDISDWDVSNVKYYGEIFDKCPIEEKYKPAKFK